MKKEYLECCKILRSHGISGGMIVEHYCDSYEVLEGLKAVYLYENGEYKKERITKCAPYKTMALITLAGIKTPEEVTRLRSTVLYAKREDILKDDGDFFIADLIGLNVIDYETKECYGTLKEVINQGAQDIYVIKREGKADAYVPVVSEFVKEISLENGIFITPIEGMID